MQRASPGATHERATALPPLFVTSLSITAFPSLFVRHTKTMPWITRGRSKADKNSAEVGQTLPNPRVRYKSEGSAADVGSAALPAAGHLPSLALRPASYALVRRPAPSAAPDPLFADTIA
ncbi:unnamed protein product [Colias eurytheme]|nr:unnamed protein product [Colias eurytheme]